MELFMKKTLVALAALGAATGAMAQSTVTLYGALDVGVAYTKNTNAAGKSNTFVNDSAIQSSLWGLKGSEDLGSGLRANFNLQGDVAMDTGAANAEFFRREANISVSSADMGELKLGRTISPAYVMSLGNQIIPQNSIGVSTALAVGYGADIFTRNAVTYLSPDMSGLKAVVQYAFGERAGPTTGATYSGGDISSSANRKMAASLMYASGPFKAGASIESVNGMDGKTTRRWANAAAQYSMGDFRFALGWYMLHKGKSDTIAANPFPSTSGSYAAAQTLVNSDVGAATAVGSHGASVGVGYQFNQQALVALTYVSNNMDSSLVNITGRYALSKRTALYGLAAIADNGNKGIKFTPLFSNQGSVADKKQGAMQVGVIHAF
jgi:predicted porin